MRDVIVETVQELTNDRLHDRFFVVFSRERFDRVDRVPNGGDDEPPSRSSNDSPPPRPGDFGDPDLHGGQQHAPLMAVEIPD